MKPFWKEFVGAGVVLVPFHDIGLHPHLDTSVSGLDHKHTIDSLDRGLGKIQTLGL